MKELGLIESRLIPLENPTGFPMFISESFCIEICAETTLYVSEWYTYIYVDTYKSERLLAGIWNEASRYTGCDLIGPSETRAEFRSRSIFFSDPAVGHRARSPFSGWKFSSFENDITTYCLSHTSLDTIVAFSDNYLTRLRTVSSIGRSLIERKAKARE